MRWWMALISIVYGLAAAVPLLWSGATAIPAGMTEDTLTASQLGALLLRFCGLPVGAAMLVMAAGGIGLLRSKRWALKAAYTSALFVFVAMIVYACVVIVSALFASGGGRLWQVASGLGWAALLGAVPLALVLSCRHQVNTDIPFYGALSVIAGSYILLIVLLMLADLAYTTPGHILESFRKPEIRYSIQLSMISCTVTAILSLLVSVPIGYLLSRHEFWGRSLLDAILDIPIVLPPLVVGLSLLILFQFLPVALRELVVYEIPAVILAQFAVACAFAVRTMRATFEQIDDRREQVALTLGCTRAQAFGLVVLPEARRGILTAGTLAWARALGEFGPLLIFAGATRRKTEVLSTTVFLEMSIGNLEAAVAVSLIMVAAAVLVLIVARLGGSRRLAL